MKSCYTCRITKQLEEFNKNKNHCKICERRSQNSLYWKNREKILKQKKLLREKDTHKDTRNKRNRERYKFDTLYRLKKTILKSFSEIFEGKKSNRSKEILGCSFEEFKIYLESKFENWMSWENKGLYNGEFNYGWDIDHIVPISSAVCVEDLIKLNHYSNLQPLCSKVNRCIKKDIILPMGFLN